MIRGGRIVLVVLLAFGLGGGGFVQGLTSRINAVRAQYAQRKAALAKAAEARRVRAEMKELLRTGSLSLSEVFERAEEEPIVANTKIYAVLTSLPGFGKIKAKRLMEDLSIAENRRVRGLGDRQRAKLLEIFS